MPVVAVRAAAHTIRVRARSESGRCVHALHACSIKMSADALKFEVNRIVGERSTGPSGGELEYLVRWVGYTPDDDTWEPAESINRQVPVIVEA